MPERLTPREAAKRVGLVIASFGIAGVLAGVVWEWVWDAPSGLVYKGRWFLEPAGPDVAFSGAALYVLIALPLGLVLGLLFARLRSHETLTLASVLVGAALAGWLMYAVGHALGPADPNVLAKGVEDLTSLPGNLVLTTDQGSVPARWVALVALPSGAMLGLAVTYLTGRQRISRRHVAKADV